MLITVDVTELQEGALINAFMNDIHKSRLTEVLYEYIVGFFIKVIEDIVAKSKKDNQTQIANTALQLFRDYKKLSKYEKSVTDKADKIAIQRKLTECQNLNEGIFSIAGYIKGRLVPAIINELVSQVKNQQVSTADVDKFIDNVAKLVRKKIELQFNKKDSNILNIIKTV